jgi:hemoglobin-like flavoprotein
VGVMQRLNTNEIELVRGSFDRIRAVSARTSDLFYGRLFEIAPEVKPLFHRDMDEQKRKFMSTLAVIVSSLDDSSKLITLTDTLARQHGEFGLRTAHYEVVGKALLWSLEQGLGRDWTPSVAASWTKAYGLVSNFMIERTPRNADIARTLPFGDC